MEGGDGGRGVSNLPARSTCDNRLPGVDTMITRKMRRLRTSCAGPPVHLPVRVWHFSLPVVEAEVRAELEQGGLPKPEPWKATNKFFNERGGGVSGERDDSLLSSALGRGFGCQ